MIGLGWAGCSEKVLVSPPGLFYSLLFCSTRPFAPSQRMTQCPGSKRVAGRRYHHWRPTKRTERRTSQPLFSTVLLLHRANCIDPFIPVGVGEVNESEHVICLSTYRIIVVSGGTSKVTRMTSAEKLTIFVRPLLGAVVATNL